MALAAIQPIQCKFCGEFFPWSETSHEDNCAHNPGNQCRYCGAGFDGDYLNPAAEKLRRHLHNLCAASREALSSYNNLSQSENAHLQRYLQNSSEYQIKQDQAISCRFCKLYFTNPSWTIEKKILHVSNCKFNPKNQCQFCGIGWSSWAGGIDAADRARLAHKKICRWNIRNRLSCQFCGLTFQNIFKGPCAVTQVNEHEQRCKHNPNNRCTYCSIIFSGHTKLRLHQLAFCPEKQEADLVRWRYAHLSSHNFGKRDRYY